MTDMDTRVRAMLRERAGDIDTLPAHLTELDTVEVLETSRRHTVWLVAAAVAAVLAIVGTLFAIRPGPGHRTPATTHSPTATHTTTTAVDQVRKTCVASLPPTWSRALAERATTLDARSALPIAASASGGVLVARDFGTHRDVALVTPSGGQRSIYTVPNPDQNTVENGVLEGHWALIPVEHLPRTAVSIIPSVVQLDLVDLDTGKVHTLDRAPIVIAEDGEQGRTIDGATMQDGRVYWDARPRYGSDSGTVRRYDINTGTTETIFTGQVTAPEATANGISWTGHPDLTVQVPASIPGEVRAASAGAQLSTDGSAYAWVAAPDVVGWWAPDSGDPRYFAFPAKHAPASDSMQDLLVAGSVVAIDDYLLDTRTGAVTQLPARFRLGGASMTTFLFGGGGVLVGYQLPGSNKQAPTALLELDLTTLATLRC